MSFCTHCGGEVPPQAAFCPYCGQAVMPAQQLTDGGAAPIAAAAPVTPANTVPVVQEPVMPVYTEPVHSSPDYSLVLVSLGTCRRSYADDVLQDIIGYTASEAKLLVRQIPVQIAQYLTMEQAQYIAQALTEYGMQVAIYLGSDPVDLGQYATRSVFNSDGSLIGAALAAIAAITASNRLRRFTRLQRPSLLQLLFRPRYRVEEPPRHVRRQIRRQIRRDPVIRRDPEPVIRRAAEPHRAGGSPRALERLDPVRTGTQPTGRAGGSVIGRSGGIGNGLTGGRSAAPGGSRSTSGRLSGSPGGHTGSHGSRGGGRSGGPGGGRR